MSGLIGGRCQVSGHFSWGREGTNTVLVTWPQFWKAAEDKALAERELGGCPKRRSRERFPCLGPTGQAAPAMSSLARARLQRCHKNSKTDTQGSSWPSVILMCEEARPVCWVLAGMPNWGPHSFPSTPSLLFPPSTLPSVLPNARSTQGRQCHQTSSPKEDQKFKASWASKCPRG